jgi:Rrf2 family transcriptional regulator, iron-sulfur cluster assembly transcription factor
MRLSVTRRADLATRALLALAVPGTKLKGAELAARLDASAGFLAQAMTPLVNAGWVRSEPGPTGGYVLVADPEALSVRHVIEAVEGPTDMVACVLEDRECTNGGPCALHGPWSRARSLLLDQLAATPLASLAPSAPAATLGAAAAAGARGDG